MINSNNMKAGTVITNLDGAKMLNWTKSNSQPISYTKNGSIIYGNRAVNERDGKFYVKSRSKTEVEVVKVGDGKYEVVL